MTPDFAHLVIRDELRAARVCFGPLVECSGSLAWQPLGRGLRQVPLAVRWGYA